MYDIGAFRLFTKSWPHQKVPIKGLSVHLEMPFRPQNLINIYLLSMSNYLHSPLSLRPGCHESQFLAVSQPTAIFLTLVSIVYTKLLLWPGEPKQRSLQGNSQATLHTVDQSADSQRNSTPTLQDGSWQKCPEMSATEVTET